MPAQKAKFLQKSLQKSDIQNQFQKPFKSALWYSFNIKLLKFFSIIFFILHFFLFTLIISFKSFLIRHSGPGRVFKDIQRALKHLKHSESTRTLGGHSERTWALEGHLGLWGHSEGSRRALTNSKSTWALRGHSSTQRAFGHLKRTRRLGGRSSTWALGGDSGTRGLRALGNSDS